MLLSATLFHFREPVWCKKNDLFLFYILFNVLFLFIKSLNIAKHILIGSKVIIIILLLK